MNYLTKTINRTNENSKKLILEITCVVLFILLIIGFFYVKGLHSQLLEAQQEITTQKVAIEVQQDTIETLNADLDNMEEQSEKIIAQNKDLVKKVNLYDKYKYVLIDSAGNRTDITTEQLELGVKLMEKEGIDPDMLFSIIMIESRGHSQAANKSSTAKGYCQLIDSTALAMWKKLGNDASQYNHSTMALNGDLNIKMGCELIATLMDQYDGNVERALNSYSGYLTADYRNKFVNYLAKGDSSIAQIEAKYANYNYS